MVKLSRYFLVILAVVGFAIVLPKLYWMAFAKPIRAPYVMYSCIDNNFVILRSGNGVKRTNIKGEELTRNEYEQKLPLLFVRQLLLNKTMPDSINGVEMDLHDITINRSTFRVRPKEVNAPQPTLFPLFESQSGRANLTMPPDFFRITWRMEFIDATTNKINEEKSRMFSAVLYKHGFKFPATTIEGIPTTRKSCDEGYFVIDSANQLFHIKMIKGEPYVHKVEVPTRLTFKTIRCVDFKNKRYYAYLFSTNNEIYILTQYDYQLIKFPIENLNPQIAEIKIYSDLFNFNVIAITDGEMRVTALNRDYQKVDTFIETWPVRTQRTEGKIAQFIFPAQLSLTNKTSGFVRFFVTPPTTFYWLIFSLLLAATHFILLKRKRVKITKHIIDFFIIAITGIFGFIAVNIFPNKFYD